MLGTDKGSVWVDDSQSNTNRPDMIAPVPWDGSYPWRSTGTGAKFSNGDLFMTWIDPKPKDLEKAGSAFHKYDYHVLTCFAYHRDFVAQLPSGEWCRSAYVCNHGENPTATSITIDVSNNNDKATLDNHVSVDTVFDTIGYSDNGTCENTWLDVPNTQCKMKTVCYENVKGVTKGMVKALKDLAKNGDSGVFQQSTVAEARWNPCKSGRDTCIGGWDHFERDITKVSQTLEVNVKDQNGNSKGHLDYELDCSQAKSCQACNNAKFTAAVASAFVGAIFGPILGPIPSLTAQGTCLANGC